MIGFILITALICPSVCDLTYKTYVNANAIIQLNDDYNTVCDGRGNDGNAKNCKSNQKTCHLEFGYYKSSHTEIVKGTCANFKRKYLDGTP